MERKLGNLEKAPSISGMFTLSRRRRVEIQLRVPVDGLCGVTDARLDLLRVKMMFCDTKLCDRIEI